MSYNYHNRSRGTTAVLVRLTLTCIPAPPNNGATMYERMNRLIAALTTGLHERDEAVRLGLLASMAGESMFLLGPPGVGKSLIARRLQMVFTDAKSFTYLMGRFSTPDEVFGPLSIRRLKQDDRYERVTTDYLPDADVVFLDEIWKASAPIRNALLTALNERLYRNGSQEMELPLKVFIGASNELPEDDETAAAFWDRFLIRLVLGQIESAEAFRSLVNDTDDVYADIVPVQDKISREEYAAFQEELLKVAVPDSIGTLLVDVRNRLRADTALTTGQYVSDRRWKKIAHLLRATALLHGRIEVHLLDCAIIRHCVWNTQEERPVSDQIVRDALTSHAGNPALIESFTQRFATLEEQLLSGSVEEIEEEATEPAVYREEYYRLVNAGDADEGARHGEDAGDSADQSIQVLIWHGDVDELVADSTGEMDLFRYDENDQLVGSESVQATRAGRWLLEIDGQKWKIETERRTTTTTRSRELGRDEQQSMIAEVQAIIADIRSETDRLLADSDTISDQAATHLFVALSFAKIVTDAMESAAEELVKIRISTEQLLSQIQASP